MGLQKERKSTFLIVFEQREKEARSLFAAQYWYQYTTWVDNKFFTKLRKIYAGLPTKRGPRQVPRSPPLKYTTDFWTVKIHEL